MIVADRLAEIHFTAQDEASPDLGEVDIVHLDSFLRGLLFTDGTVSRALEAHTLSSVAVEPVEQTEISPPARAARYLEVRRTEECIRRRVIMTISAATPSVWAESYVAPQRLPPTFLGVLGGDSQGIGGSLQQLRLESWRELLWFGLGPPPEWSGAQGSDATTLTRFYRIITGGRPALLISEAFAVEMHAGRYRLIGSAEPHADAANGSARRFTRTGTIDANDIVGGDATSPSA
jgi:chorismate-pyruvate lyase